MLFVTFNFMLLQTYRKLQQYKGLPRTLYPSSLIVYILIQCILFSFCIEYNLESVQHTNFKWTNQWILLCKLSVITNQIKIYNIPALPKSALGHLPFTNFLQRETPSRLLSLEFDFACFRISHKWNHTISTFLYLNSFIQ